MAEAVSWLQMQRLFSTFASGLPGLGLLLQRLVAATVLVCRAAAHPNATSQSVSSAPHIVGAVAGIFLLVGLWTPAVGATVSGVELWVLLSSGGDLWTSLVLATLGATLAMIGPGAWSIDARLFGRKQIKTSST